MTLDYTRTWTSTVRTLAVVLVAAALPLDGSAQSRVWADATIATRPVVPGSIDSKLLDPQPFAVGKEIVAVFDYGDMAVKAFDIESGALMWTVGREGRGPSEFQNPTDIAISSGDTVWVLDPANMRVSVIGAGGAPSHLLRIEERIRRFVVWEGHLIGARSNPAEGPFVVLDREGVYEARVEVPTWISEMPSLAFELRMAVDRSTGDVAAALWYTGHILIGQAVNDGTLREIRGIASGEVPKPMVLTPAPNITASRLPPSTRAVVRDIAVEGTLVYVLASDELDDARTVNIIDVYDKSEGYRYSLRLPRAASRLEIADGRLFVLERGMLPTISEIIVRVAENSSL